MHQFITSIYVVCYHQWMTTRLIYKMWPLLNLPSNNFYVRQHICFSAYMLLPSVRPSVCPSLCPSVCHTVDQSKTVEARITKFWPYSSPIPLVFREQVLSWNSGGSPRAGALNEGWVGKIGAISPKRCKIGLKLLLITDRNVYMRFPWYQNQWPWVTPDPGFKVMVDKIGDFWSLSCHYLKNGWR